MADQATQANATDIWEGDLLNRREDAAFLINFLTRRVAENKAANRPASVVLNVDAKWGQGKTYFMQRLQKQLKAAGYLAPYINAWEDDHADDPLVALVAGLNAEVAATYEGEVKKQKVFEKVARTGAKLVVTAAKGVAAKAGELVMGEAAEQVFEIVNEDLINKGVEAGKKQFDDFLDEKGKEFLKRFEAAKETIKQFREALGKAVAAQGDDKPIFILIDELDRCRPPYAIALLERAKHLFNVDGVVFIVATDTGQLQHAIGGVYGVGFDSQRYLKRFFDRTYQFTETSRRAFIDYHCASTISSEHREKLSLPAQATLETTALAVANAFALDLRGIEQCLDLLRSILTVWEEKLQIELIYMLPLIAAFHTSPERFDTPEHVAVITAKSDMERVRPLQFETQRFQNPVEGQRGGRYVTENKEVAYLKAFEAFAQAKDKALHIAVESSANQDRASRGDLSAWIAKRLDAEYRHYFPSGRPVDDERFSILRRYPELIRQAGRLSKAPIVDFN